MEGVAYVKNFAGTGIWICCSLIFNTRFGPLLVPRGWALSSGQYSVVPCRDCYSHCFGHWQAYPEPVYPERVGLHAFADNPTLQGRLRDCILNRTWTTNLSPPLEQVWNRLKIDSLIFSCVQKQSTLAKGCFLFCKVYHLNSLIILICPHSHPFWKRDTAILYLAFLSDIKNCCTKQANCSSLLSP